MTIGHLFHEHHRREIVEVPILEHESAQDAFTMSPESESQGSLPSSTALEDEKSICGSLQAFQKLEKLTAGISTIPVSCPFTSGFIQVSAFCS